MGVIHRYKGQFDWEGVELSRYPPERDMKGVSVRWLIGPGEEAARGLQVVGRQVAVSAGGDHDAVLAGGVHQDEGDARGRLAVAADVSGIHAVVGQPIHQRVPEGIKAHAPDHRRGRAQ